jgi:hypothetical protein
MEHGKNIRSPSLEKGTSYIMKIWAKTYTFEQVLFDGFMSNGQCFKSPTKQLKDMEPTDLYKFVGETSGVFTGKMLDNCLVHSVSEARLTFFALANSTTALTPAPDALDEAIDEVIATVEAAELVTVYDVTNSDTTADDIVYAEVEAVETPVIEPEVHVETSIERKRRLDRERKAALRAATRAAVMPVAEEQVAA